ncbi:MAG: M1 family aminopeptidase [Bacteroidales bacterium]
MRITRIIITAFVVLLASGCSNYSIIPGVTLELAQQRKAQISDITYNLSFNIPAQISDSISGIVDIVFSTNQEDALVIDFRAQNNMVQSVSVDGKRIDYKFSNGHIFIPSKYLNKGENTVSISFISNDGSLNRRNEFLYTLLVPDRASTVFPCFDQPDLKANFTLNLNLPSEWVAISNSKITESAKEEGNTKQITFEPTKPISTYLFAFAAGKFEVVTKTINNRTFNAYHRETDKGKVERNLPILFDLHDKALNWLEEYTQIEYPFGKLDFILIPGFQYGGMEHAGAIFYSDSRLLLNENPTEKQMLGQANLIAHEVSHQWFGNLVTMRWFNDVWLKEVFAGFMADLIVNPQYPNINHELNFVLSHFPRAYSVDRTQGANPIVQSLDNLLNAGTLYGDIIYHKSPIMMQQLVGIMGERQFQQGVIEYLKTYSMQNAEWSELVSILNKYTDEDLSLWAKIWTEETGRPKVRYQINPSDGSITFTAMDSTPFPPSLLDISTLNGNSQRIWVNELPFSVKIEKFELQNPTVIANTSGIGYGCFIPDSTILNQIISSNNSFKNPVTRASNHLLVYEMFTENLIDISTYLNFLLGSLSHEKESQIQSFTLNALNTVFWKFAKPVVRQKFANDIEQLLWNKIISGNSANEKRAFFNGLTTIFTTDESFSRLYDVWNASKVNDISLSENERTELAYQLMIRKPELYHTIALGEIERIDNPDRAAKFEFMLGAVSSILSQRLDFFDKLKTPSNRKPESWVTNALYLLHHPLRSDFSIRFIEPSLDMLLEIQQTGDIFFPKNWLDATFSGHSSVEAKEIVEDWLNANPTLSPNLRLKVLQSADLLFRSASM